MDSQAPAQRIAIVDDDHDIRLMLRMVLDGEGYEVIEAQNGREALRLLRSSPPVTLIILDLKMPIMNGAEFREAQLADAALRDIPVLVLSGDAGVAEAAAALRAAGYLTKPPDLDDLLAAVAAIRRDPRAAPP